MKTVFIILIMIILSLSGMAEAASLTKPITLEWGQNKEAFIVPAGQTKIPLNSWKLFQKDSPTGTPTAVVAVPYVPTQLSATVNADGTRTYTYGPMTITKTGVGGSTVQACFHVTALGNDTTPLSETVASNTACESFILPADPLPAPGTPTNMVIK